MLTLGPRHLINRIEICQSVSIAVTSCVTQQSENHQLSEPLSRDPQFMLRISASLLSVRAGMRSCTSSRPVSASDGWKGAERFLLRTLCLRSHLRSSWYFLIISTSLVNRWLRYHVLCPLATAGEAEHSCFPVPCPRSRYPPRHYPWQCPHECRTELSISSGIAVNAVPPDRLADSTSTNSSTTPFMS
jgi:hypothetical protein